MIRIRRLFVVYFCLHRGKFAGNQLRDSANVQCLDLTLLLLQKSWRDCKSARFRSGIQPADAFPRRLTQRMPAAIVRPRSGHIAQNSPCQDKRLMPTMKRPMSTNVAMPRSPNWPFLTHLKAPIRARTSRGHFAQKAPAPVNRFTTTSPAPIMASTASLERGHLPSPATEPARGDDAAEAGAGCGADAGATFGSARGELSPTLTA